MTNYEWLQTAPLPSEIKVKNGGKYIPYRTIVDKLNKLCDDNWSVKNFNESYVLLPKGRVLISGNVEVDVCYFDKNNKWICRTLAGGANFILNKNCNLHFTATIKSLAIMNAVKVLGKTFGLDLNDEDLENEVNQLPVIRTEKKEEVDMEKQTILELIQTSRSLPDLKGWETLANKHKLSKQYQIKLKQLTDVK